jgi:hypothetical protein
LQEVIFTAVSFHNKLEIPKKLNGRELLHTRLLRDADKLDIYESINRLLFRPESNTKPHTHMGTAKSLPAFHRVRPKKSWPESWFRKMKSKVKWM